MSSKKSTWKMYRQKSTGRLLFSYWERQSIDKSDTETIEPISFSDELTYVGYYHTASGIAVKWISKFYNGTQVISSINFLNDLFNELIDTKLQVVNLKPLTITGNFKFAKRGNSIRIIEDE